MTRAVVYLCPKCGSNGVGYKIWWDHMAAPGVFYCAACGHEGERHDFAVWSTPKPLIVSLEGL